MADDVDSTSVTGRKLLVLWLIFLIYLLFGGLIFNLLEKDNEDEQREIARAIKREFVNNYTCLDVDAFEDLLSSLLLIQSQGVDPRGNATGPSKWDFTSSLFFSGTVVTTIGYGNISPTSKGSQQFCICYALIGIPLCGFVLAALGDRIKNQSLKFKEHVVDRCKKNKLITFMRADVFYMVMICISGFFIFFLIPAVVFAHVENWTYHSSFYYTFITLSTIGFGDYVAGTNTDKNYNVVYRLMIYVWILFGLVYFILLLGHVSDLMSTAGKKIKRKTMSMKGKHHAVRVTEILRKEEKVEERNEENDNPEKISLENFDNSMKTEAEVNVSETSYEMTPASNVSSNI